MTQAAHYEQFLALHEQPEAFVMPNVWDGLSALIMREKGFPALATSSAALAAALGRHDGRHAVSAKEHLAHAKLLIEVGGLPVNGDFEDGYGHTPDDVAATVSAAIEVGLAGIGIEDTSGNPANPIRGFDDAVTRVRAAAQAARGRIVLTGRTDNFLYRRNDLDDTIRRLTAFAEAGADVLYAPYPPDMDGRSNREGGRPEAGQSRRRHQVRDAHGRRTLAGWGEADQHGSGFVHPPRHGAASGSDALSHGDLAAATAGISLREVDALIEITLTPKLQ